MEHFWLAHDEIVEGIRYNVVCKYCRALGRKKNNTWPRQPGAAVVETQVMSCDLHMVRHVMET